MPIAVCSVDRGRSRALRISDATRLAKPSSVSTSAQPARKRQMPGAAHTANAAASVNPDAPPSSVKLITVSGLAHSRRNGRQA